MGVLASQEVLGGRKICQLERCQLGVAVHDSPFQVLLELAAAAQAPRDLVVAKLLLEPEVEGGTPLAPGAGRQPQAQYGRSQSPDQGRELVDHEADDRGGQPGDRERPRRDREPAPPGFRDRDLEVDRGRPVAQLGAELGDLAVQDPESLDHRAKERQRVPGWVALLEADDLVGDGHRLLIPLEALPGDLALGGEPFRVAGLLQE